MSAAGSTVEALMWSLRTRGTAALDEADTRVRVNALDEEQLHTVAERLQKLRPHITQPWTAESIEILVAAWVDFQDEYEFSNKE